jgi:hypothetical protein
MNRTFGSMSADGRYLAFYSTCNTIVPAESGGVMDMDVFVYDRDADADGVFDEPGAVGVQLVSVNPPGSPPSFNLAALGGRLTSNGQYCVFTSYAAPQRVHVHDRATGVTSAALSFGYNPDISDDARYVMFTQQLSVPCGHQRHRLRSYDANTGVIQTILQGADPCGPNRDVILAAASSTGRFALLNSMASNIVAGNGLASSVFLHDRDTDGDEVFDEPGASSTVLVSNFGSASIDDPSNALSAQCLSDDGRFAVFEATRRGRQEVYLWDRLGATGPPAQPSADFNGDGVVNSADLFEFLAAFFAGDADLDGNGSTDSADFFAFLALFFG